jgi:hypothetical protein
MVARIEPPSLPLYLYRYRSLHDRPGAKRGEIFKRELTAIKKSYIWCSKFAALNDPMEGFYHPSSTVRHKTDYDRIAEQISQGKSGIGIASLSDTRENELMWTHYAGNYSGICIRYYAERLRNALPSTISLVRLGYDERPPRLTNSDIKVIGQAARKIFAHKKFNWAYEREWRLLGPVGAVKFERKDCIRTVYLGSRIAGAHKAEILRQLKGLDIDVYEMDIEGYEHDWRRIQDAPRRTAKNKADGRP